MFKGPASQRLRITDRSDRNNTSAYVKKIRNKNYSKNGPGADVCLIEPDLTDASRGP